MNINKFAEKVAKLEGKKKSIDIAQIKEILACINKLTKGCFYMIIDLI